MSNKIDQGNLFHIIAMLEPQRETRYTYLLPENLTILLTHAECEEYPKAEAWQELVNRFTHSIMGWDEKGWITIQRYIRGVLHDDSGYGNDVEIRGKQQQPRKAIPIRDTEKLAQLRQDFSA